jgi:hypothetical protein
MPPADSYVTSATIKDGQIELSVQVDDFPDNETVEISGVATQSGGAFANYYDIQKVPAAVAAADGTSHKTVTVATHPIPPNKFMQDQDVTVVLRVSRVWVTVLGKPTATSKLANQPQPGTTWGTIKVVSSMDGTNWS